MNFIDLEKTYGFEVYPKRDVIIIKGKGTLVWGSDGKEYIDCTTGNGSAILGHSSEIISKILCEQSKELISCSNIFYNDKRARLLKKLVEISPKSLKKAFLCNSGAESIEAAIKFARYTTGKKMFVCAMKGFHGRTYGAMSATFNPISREGFGPFVPGFRFVPFNNFEKLEKAVNGDTAGIILELIQGESGVNIGDRVYFERVRKLCNDKGVLLIVDEVQTGFARTGRLFACEYFDLQPDIMCLAKGMAGGVPIGAVLTSEKIKAPIGKHGATFGGSPLVCSVSYEVINYIVKKKLWVEVEEKGRYFVEKLKEKNLEKIKEVRSKGLMIGIELNEKSKEYIIRLIENGLLVLSSSSSKVIRLLPPLVISYDELDKVIEKLAEVLK